MRVMDSEALALMHGARGAMRASRRASFTPAPAYARAPCRSCSDEPMPAGWTSIARPTPAFGSGIAQWPIAAPGRSDSESDSSDFATDLTLFAPKCGPIACKSEYRLTGQLPTAVAPIIPAWVYGPCGQEAIVKAIAATPATNRSLVSNGEYPYIWTNAPCAHDDTIGIRASSKGGFEGYHKAPGIHADVSHDPSAPFGWAVIAHDEMDLGWEGWTGLHVNDCWPLKELCNRCPAPLLEPSPDWPTPPTAADIEAIYYLFDAPDDNGSFGADGGTMGMVRHALAWLHMPWANAVAQWAYCIAVQPSRKDLDVVDSAMAQIEDLAANPPAKLSVFGIPFFDQLATWSPEDNAILVNPALDVWDGWAKSYLWASDDDKDCIARSVAAALLRSIIAKVDSRATDSSAASGTCHFAYRASNIWLWAVDRVFPIGSGGCAASPDLGQPATCLFNSDYIHVRPRL